MSFKDILVLFTEPERASECTKVAVGIASLDAGRVIGVYLAPQVSLLGGGLPYTGSPSEIKALAAIEAKTRADAEAAAARAEKAFTDAVAAEGLAGEWHRFEGDVVPNALIHARHADLVVINQSNPDHSVPAAHQLLESVLLGSGRPILIMPFAGRFNSVGRHAMVAWNASREAARAVNDALPILERAEKVIVFSANPPSAASGGPDLPGAEIALHLSRHGVNVETSSTVSHDIDVGNAMLSRAADFGADLIVMGGYGHSRQREFLLGGVTRTLLQHMTVPVFMSH